MKHLIITGCLSLCIIQACSQSRNAPKAYAFIQHMNYGTVAVDDKGNQVTPGSRTTRSVYVECTGNTKPLIQKISYNDIVYKNPPMISLGDKQVQVGIRKADGENIILLPAHGYKLWKIELQVPVLQPHAGQINANEKTPPQKIIISGKQNGRSFTLTINNEVELQPIAGV